MALFFNSQFVANTQLYPDEVIIDLVKIIQELGASIKDATGKEPIGTLIQGAFQSLCKDLEEVVDLDRSGLIWTDPQENSELLKTKGICMFSNLLDTLKLQKYTFSVSKKHEFMF